MLMFVVRARKCPHLCQLGKKNATPRLWMTGFPVASFEEFHFDFGDAARVKAESFGRDDADIDANPCWGEIVFSGSGLLMPHATSDSMGMSIRVMRSIEERGLKDKITSRFSRHG